jgi:hypothetical protein
MWNDFSSIHESEYFITIIFHLYSSGNFRSITKIWPTTFSERISYAIICSLLIPLSRQFPGVSTNSYRLKLTQQETEVWRIPAHSKQLASLQCLPNGHILLKLQAFECFQNHGHNSVLDVWCGSTLSVAAAFTARTPAVRTHHYEDGISPHVQFVSLPNELLGH